MLDAHEFDIKFELENNGDGDDDDHLIHVDILSLQKLPSKIRNAKYFRGRGTLRYD